MLIANVDGFAVAFARTTGSGETGRASLAKAGKKIAPRVWRGLLSLVLGGTLSQLVEPTFSRVLRWSSHWSDLGYPFFEEMPKASKRSASSSGRETDSAAGVTAGGGPQNSSHQPYGGKDNVVVHQHDVLNGRGVNMAHHPGNERFRSLIQSRSDPSYCSSYSIIEKKALSEEIVRHIESLDPPGRFLKRSGKTKNRRGLQGPWEIMSREEAVKKARQALRDCNRLDRDGYARSVAAPADVLESTLERKNSGLSQQQYVQQLVVTNPPSPSVSRTSSGRATPRSDPNEAFRKKRGATSPVPARSVRTSEVVPDPTISWIPNKLVDGGECYNINSDSHDASQTTPNLRNSTPTTAATSGGLFSGAHDDFTSESFHQHHHTHTVVDVAGAPAIDSPSHSSQFDHGLTASPPAPGTFEALAASFEDDSKPMSVAHFPETSADPLQAEVDAEALTRAFDEDLVAAFERDALNM